MDTSVLSTELLMSVGEILKVIPHVRVISGSKGLNRIVRSVTIMDSPEIADWLQGGEFLLVNGYFLRDDPDSAQRLIRDAARVNAAAVGIKLQRFIDTIPKEALDAAEESGLPIIEMPRDIAWKPIVDSVYRNLHRTHEQILRLSNEAFRLFSALARRGSGPQEILDEIRRRIGRGVWLLDVGFAPQLYPPSQGPPPTGDFRQVYERWRNGGYISVAEGYPPSHPLQSLGADANRVIVRQGEQTSGPTSYLIARINVRMRRSAYLAVAETEGWLTEEQLILVLQAREVLSVLLSRDQALLQGEVERRNRLLLGLVRGQSSDPSAVTELRQLGCDLSRPQRVVAIEMERPPGEGSAELRLLERICAKQGSGAQVVYSEEETLLLVPASAKEQLTGNSSNALALALAIQRGQTEQLGSRQLWSFGIGQLARAVSELPRSYAEAKKCLELGIKVRGRGTIGTVQELAVYVLLDRLRNCAECRTQIDQFLTPLEHHDAQYHSDLLETLQVFLASPGGIQEAASRLFVHRNTVRLRLAKIQEILGISLNDPDSRLLLEILLRLRQLGLDTTEA